jgi:hypothetical protein
MITAGKLIEHGTSQEPPIKPATPRISVDGSSKFFFDPVEPERPRVDRAVLDFVKATVFDPADFTIRNDGVVRLNPEMARMVVAKVSA